MIAETTLKNLFPELTDIPSQRAVDFIRSRPWYWPDLDDDLIAFIERHRDVVTKKRMVEMLDAHFSVISR